MDIQINVQNKIATLADPQSVIVCGNSDYIINFLFDEEWAAHSTKTARFTYNGLYTDIVFNGNKCPVPILSKCDAVFVGVYAGNLATTTPAFINCKKSILCNNGTNVPQLAGCGVPMGGEAGQVLAKKSGENYDLEWKDQIDHSEKIEEYERRIAELEKASGGGGGGGTKLYLHDITFDAKSCGPKSTARGMVVINTRKEPYSSFPKNDIRTAINMFVVVDLDSITYHCTIRSFDNFYNSVQMHAPDSQTSGSLSLSSSQLTNFKDVVTEL